MIVDSNESFSRFLAKGDGEIDRASLEGGQAKQ